MDVEEIISEEFKVREVDDNVEEILTPKDRLLSLLDQVEANVETFRKKASKLEREKDQLLNILQTFNSVDLIADFDDNDREDIIKYKDRIKGRCKTVNINVHTERDDSQIESLHRVNCLINYLIIEMNSNIDSTRTKCLSYVSSCSSSAGLLDYGVDQEIQIDQNFENAILGCALDDQKRIKQRLDGLLEYITKEKCKKDVQPIE